MEHPELKNNEIARNAAETTRILSTDRTGVDHERIMDLSRDHIASVLDRDPRESSLAG
jgi:hypothetical protein